LGLATGGNLYVARVASELSRLGVEVSLITLVPPRDIPWDPALRLVSSPAEFTFGVRPEGRRWISFLQAKLAAVRDLRKLVREPYDILYSVGGPSNIVNHLCQGGLFRPRASVAAVFHLFRQVSYPRFLRNPETYTRPFQTFYHTWGDALARRFPVITVSNYWRDKLIARGFQPDRIRVIPVGAETNNWPALEPEAAKRELDLAGRLVIYTSPLRLNKGILQVLEALHDLKDRFPRVIVLATGVTDRRTRERVERFVGRHGLQEHFRYEGVVSRERIPFYHYAADVVVLASQEEEGWGIFLLEGMGAGKPVVCTPLGAMPELVGDRGIVLTKNTVDDLTRALVRLLASPELRQELGRAGVAAAARYSYESAARAHLELFEELLTDR